MRSKAATKGSFVHVAVFDVKRTVPNAGVRLNRPNMRCCVYRRIVGILTLMPRTRYLRDGMLLN